MKESLELIIDSRSLLAEGPCWQSDQNQLYWVDIAGMKIHVYDPSRGSNRTLEIGQSVGAVVPRKKGGAVAALQKGFYFVDMESGGLTPIYDPESHIPQNRFNDGKCDATGRFWAGTMSMNEKGAVGSLYCLELDLTVRKVLDGISISNGIAWSPDNTIMYYVDSLTRQVAAFDYDLATGSIENKRIVVTIPPGGGVPDGMTIDEEGMLWIAQWGGYQVSRWDPRTGKMLDHIPVPAECVSSCCFGGPNLDELYITTARTGSKPETLEKLPHAGGVFRIKTGIRGAQTYSFGG